MNRIVVHNIVIEVLYFISRKIFDKLISYNKTFVLIKKEKQRTCFIHNLNKERLRNKINKLKKIKGQIPFLSLSESMTLIFNLKLLFCFEKPLVFKLQLSTMTKNWEK